MNFNFFSSLSSSSTNSSTSLTDESLVSSASLPANSTVVSAPQSASVSSSPFGSNCPSPTSSSSSCDESQGRNQGDNNRESLPSSSSLESFPPTDSPELSNPSISPDTFHLTSLNNNNIRRTNQYLSSTPKVLNYRNGNNSFNDQSVSANQLGESASLLRRSSSDSQTSTHIHKTIPNSLLSRISSSSGSGWLNCLRLGWNPSAESSRLHASPFLSRYSINSRVSIMRWFLIGITIAAICWYIFIEPAFRPTPMKEVVEILEDFKNTHALDNLYKEVNNVPHSMDNKPTRTTPTNLDDAISLMGESSSHRGEYPATSSRFSSNLTHLTSLTHIPCASCSFTFPRPTPKSRHSSFFVTGLPNPGAGVGHQFHEWVTGPYLAKKHNLTYVYSDFQHQSKRWNTFLGLADGELTRQDVELTYGPFQRTLEADYPTDLEELKTYNVSVWAETQLKQILSNPQFQRRMSENGVSSSPPSSNHLIAAQSSLTPNLPAPILLQTHFVSVPLHTDVCEPDIHRTIRQKYCLARLRNPVKQNLYADNRRQNKIIITWHLRCGDECFSSYRTTSFDSVVNTCWKLNELFRQLEPNRQLSFHFFSQKPHNGTAEDHFAPLIKRLHPMETHTHWHTKSTSVMHHLITSDVLFGSISGFSWVSFLYHNRVAIGSYPSCTDHIKYDKLTGEFNQQQFINAWSKYKDQLPKFESFQDCLNIQ